MVKKFVVAFAILAMALAFAGTIPTAKTSFQVTLDQPSVVNGTELKPGDYRLSIGDSKITLVQGKKTVEAPATIQTVDSKFDTTTIDYTTKGGKQVVSEIDLGGSRTKVVLNR